MQEICYHEEYPDVVAKGLECYASEIENYVLSCVLDIIEECDLNIDVICVYMHGSRVFGKPRKKSDIDVVIFYDGDFKEDGLFNIFHDEDYNDMFSYDGLKIDINPIQLYGDFEEEIQHYIKTHDPVSLDESVRIIKIKESNILNESIPYALADNPSGYYSAFSYEIMPLMTNLSQGGNDREAYRQNKHFEFFVGDIVKGVSPIDDKDHKCQIVYLFFDKDQMQPKYVYAQEFKTKRIIPLYPKTLRKFKYINKEELLRQATNIIPCNPIIDI